MKYAVAVLLCLSVGLAACQEETSPSQQNVQDAPLIVVDPISVNTDVRPTVTSVLDLTDDQLLEASIVDTAGIDIGEVDAIVRDAEGKIEKFLVEVENSSPNKFVYIEAGQVIAVEDKGDWNLRAPLTREDLMAMPSVTR